MERYLQIEKVNLKHNVWIHVLVTLILIVLSPFLMGVANLAASDTAKVLEMFVALIGIVMLPPVFLPEQNKDLRDLVYSKFTKASTVYIVRLLGNIIMISIVLFGYVWMLKANGCKFPEVGFFLGTLAEMIFLGGMGVFAYGLADHIVIGYMAPLFYYMIAVGSGDKYLGKFYLFSMVRGSYEEKIYLAFAGVLLIIAGILLRSRRK